MRKRLKALEATVVQEGLILTEAQVVAWEKVTAEKEAPGEFESAYPGYGGAQNTFSVGTLTGRRPDLPTDLHRHRQQSGLREAG